jgi:hypothetical protein
VDLHSTRNPTNTNPEKTMSSYNDNFKARVESVPELAAFAHEQIRKVEMIRLPKGFFRYLAVMASGARLEIRAKATRYYPLAHLHNQMVCTGKQGLGMVFSFGQKPAFPEALLRTYVVQTEDQP